MVIFCFQGGGHETHIFSYFLIFFVSIKNKSLMSIFTLKPIKFATKPARKLKILLEVKLSTIRNLQSLPYTPPRKYSQDAKLVAGLILFEVDYINSMVLVTNMLLFLQKNAFLLRKLRKFVKITQNEDVIFESGFFAVFSIKTKANTNKIYIFLKEKNRFILYN